MWCGWRLSLQRVLFIGSAAIRSDWSLAGCWKLKKGMNNEEVGYRYVSFLEMTC